MKHLKVSLAVVMVFIMSVVLLTGCANGNTSNNSNNASVSSQQQGSQTSTKPDTGKTTSQTDTTVAGSTANTELKVTADDTDGDGIPDKVEKTYGTNPYNPDTDGDGQNDKVDKDPNFAENPITETNTVKLPVTIKDARVEDNATADHLEITLTNTGDTELKNFDIYFTVTDKVVNKKDAYYVKLDNLSVKPGEAKTIHFDNKKEANHYFGNMNGLYGTSTNELIFDVLLHNTNYQTLNFQVKKAKGTAEVAD
jgi:hypothetical protein